MTHDASQVVSALVRQFGLWRTVTAPFVVVPVLVAFGVVTGTSTAGFLTVSASFVVLLVIAVALAAQVRHERLARDGLDRAVTQLTATVLEESPGGSYVWERWRERVTVTSNGDTVIEQWRTLRVTGTGPLRVVWCGVQQSTGTVTQWQRRNIVVTAFATPRAAAARTSASSTTL